MTDTARADSASSSHDQHHRPDIQGLRAIAVLLVLIFHAGLPLSGGFIGVDVFFVISGYVITAMLAREAAADGDIDLRRFYLRRVLRLLPALIAVVGVTVLLSSVILSPFGPQQTAARTAAATLLFVANQQIAAIGTDYFAPSAEVNPLVHTWSLAVEEQFYLAFPLLLAVTWRWARHRRRPAAAPIVMVCVVLIASCALAVAGDSVTLPEPLLWLTGYYSPLTRAWEFAAGALLALLIPQLQRLPAQLVRLIAWPAAAVLLLSALVISEDMPFPGWWTFMPVGATAVLLITGVSPGVSRVNTWLSSPWLRWIGDRSYALYLWHWPFVVFARLLFPFQPLALPLATVLAVLPAVVSYRLLEEPLRRQRDTALMLRTTRRIAAAAAAAVVLSIAAWLITEQVTEPWIASLDPLRRQAPMRSPTIVEGCQKSLFNKDTVPCRWNSTADGRPLYLIGDSNAGHHSAGLIVAAEMANRPLAALTGNACIFGRLNGSAALPENQQRRCGKYTKFILGWLQHEPAGTVLISVSDMRWLSGLRRLNPAQQQAEVQFLATALTDGVRQLQQFGHQVVFIRTVPHFVDRYYWDDSRCTLLQHIQLRCVAQAPRAALEAQQAPFFQAVERAAAATESTIIDVNALICPDGICVTSNDRGPIYGNANHIADRFSQSMGPAWADLLADQ